MKKTCLCLLLCAVLILGLCACTGKEDARQETAAQSGLAADFADVTLYDDNNVQIAATTLIDTQSGLALCMKCTNNNKFAIGLWSSQTAVNGFTVVGSLLQNVEAGETVTMQLVMDNDELSGIGIKQIAQMSLTLYIDNLEENTQLAYTPILSFSLPGVSAPAPSVPEGTVLADQDGVRVSSLGFLQEDDGLCISLLIENNTELTALVNASAITLDGETPKDAYMAEEVLPGTIRYGKLRLGTGVKPGTVNFTLTVSNFSTWEQLFQCTDLTVAPD